MQCVAAGHQIVALANLRPAENQGKCIHILESSLKDWNSSLIIAVLYTICKQLMGTLISLALFRCYILC